MKNAVDLAPRPPSPDLPGAVIVRESVHDVVDVLAADLYAQAQGCARTFGDFHLALSGGSTPQPLYRRLMYDPRVRSLPWMRTHLWVVDERRVPLDDDRSNFKMIRELIVEHSDIPAEQVHPIRATDDDAAEAYERSLCEALEWREPGHDRLDFVLLGMGDDLHTAGIFPFSPALDADGHLVMDNSGPTVVPPDRITMTLRLINASRFVAVMVTGSAKREAIARLAAGGLSEDEAPVAGVRPLGGELRWYLDREACPPGA